MIPVDITQQKLNVNATQNSRVVYLVDDEQARLSVPVDIRYEGFLLYQKDS
jgi:hypothetical protein